jgi:outer membrane protein assembly factor BamB
MLPIFLLSVLTFVSSVVNAQSVVWDTQIEGSNTFSSPRAIDLTGDGVPDVVIGCGRELADTSFGVFAFDGLNGEILWSTKTRSQIFGSPMFNDVSGDGTPDVVIGGRRSQFYCIDGSTGRSSGRAICVRSFPIVFPTVCQIFTQDSGWVTLNGDGIPEIVNIRGGFAPADANDGDRPAGNVVIVDGASGAVLREYEMPDGKESYSSPVLWQDASGDIAVVFGSGGETVGGSLWAATVTSLWNGNPEFIELAVSASKGIHVARQHGRHGC